ncbi:hypothetical protein Leryth_016309 [Lithospermum erythrorhizon]|nr:hypothetical protein Leryth_016309 [Lithospermum erythrorhizon]
MRRCTSLVVKLELLLLLFLFVLTTSSSEGDFEQCESTVKKWASSSLDTEVKEDNHLLRDLLFFLHIPRTGGRTYFHCFLKKLYKSSLECPRSYDKLRFNPRKSDCRLLVTHDDYSMMSKLTKEKTSVVTIFRNPIDRVFSTYEFSIEVAARFLVHPNLTSALAIDRLLRSRTKGVSTLNIWPWKYLVPWMREDLFKRRDAKKLKGLIEITSNDSYNMEDVVMPLHQYINDPTAVDIIHNGATFQIAGLTNNSYLSASHEVRHCVLKFRTLGQHVLDIAKKRLDDMLYVGLTENHEESASMFADVVGAQVISQFTPPSVLERNSVDHSSSLEDFGPDSHHDGSNSSLPEPSKSYPIEKVTTGKLIKAYQSCITSLRKTQTERRISSLKRIFPANFTKEARLQVPQELLQEIASLNSLDMELYTYAKGIFLNQHKRVAQVKDAIDKPGKVSQKAERELKISNSETYVEMPESELKISYGDISWKVLLLITSTLLLLVFVLLYVNSKGRTPKVKL